MVIDLQTGLRKQELLSLRWQNVDFGRDVIHVMNSRRERTKSVRATHATGDGIRRAMQLLTQTGVGNGKVVQLQNWTDTKVPTLNGNGQHALPVSA